MAMIILEYLVSSEITLNFIHRRCRHPSKHIIGPILTLNKNNFRSMILHSLMLSFETMPQTVKSTANGGGCYP